MQSLKTLFYGGDGNQAARYQRITLGIIVLQLDHSSSLQFTHVTRQFIHAFIYY